jgi:hypothetical protein
MPSQWFRFSESWVAERCAASYASKHIRSRPRMTENALLFKRTALAQLRRLFTTSRDETLLRGGTGWATLHKPSNL